MGGLTVQVHLTYNTIRLGMCYYSVSEWSCHCWINACSRKLWTTYLSGLYTILVSVFLRECSRISLWGIPNPCALSPWEGIPIHVKFLSRVVEMLDVSCFPISRVRPIRLTKQDSVPYLQKQKVISTWKQLNSYPVPGQVSITTAIMALPNLPQCCSLFSRSFRFRTKVMILSRRLF